MRNFLISLLILLLTVVSLEARSTESRKVVLQAEDISGDTSYLYAHGHVMLNYDETRFISEHAKYDKRKGILTVHGAVRIINADGSVVETNKVTLQVAQEYVVFEKFFYKDQDQVWLSSVIAFKKKDCYRLQQAMFSTCAVSNPDWHLGFSEADYNTTSKYIKLKDIKFYVGDTPIFYFPYLAFSTSKERSSGLLMPRIGYSSTEGFVYEQPIYWAISPSMDLELAPQIRTDRSIGMYSTLRFADSAYSEGSLSLGYFRDKDTYVEKYNLENSTHYGLEAHYESSNILGDHKPKGYQDALYTDIVLFNDIDYLNLQKKKLDHLSDSHLKESRLNYLLYDENNYFGLNAKYFLDANKESNKETLQELPSLRWHLFDRSLGSDAFSYSMDAKLSHFIREEGTGAKQLEIDIPMAYQISLADDYLNIELSENIYSYMGDFDRNEVEDQSYSTLLATHKLKAYADLVHSYASSTHTLEWEASYEKQNYIGDGLAEYHALDDSLRKDFLSHKPFDDRVALAINQYWYIDDLDLQAKQRISQSYYPDRAEKWGDLRHELAFDHNKWSVVNLSEYSFEYEHFSEMSNRLRYKGEQLDLDLEHFWRKDLEADMILTNELAFDLKYQYNKRLKLFGGITYDLEEKESKKWNSGLRYDKGCWNVELSYVHDTKPLLAKDGGGSVSNNTFLVKFDLLSFGESETRQ